MVHFMIVSILYINLLDVSWIKMSIFEEYGVLRHRIYRRDCVYQGLLCSPDIFE